MSKVRTLPKERGDPLTDAIDDGPDSSDTVVDIRRHGKTPPIAKAAPQSGPESANGPKLQPGFDEKVALHASVYP